MTVTLAMQVAGLPRSLIMRGVELPVVPAIGDSVTWDIDFCARTVVDRIIMPSEIELRVQACRKQDVDEFLDAGWACGAGGEPEGWPQSWRAPR